MKKNIYVLDSSDQKIDFGLIWVAVFVEDSVLSYSRLS